MRLGIIADDLTGAGDAGLQFHRKGLRTWVISQLPPADAPFRHLPRLSILQIRAARRASIQLVQAKPPPVERAPAKQVRVKVMPDGREQVKMA